MIQIIDVAIRFLIAQELDLLAKFPVIGSVIFSMLILNFALTTAQNKTQLVYWSLATVAVVVAVLVTISGGTS